MTTSVPLGAHPASVAQSHVQQPPDWRGNSPHAVLDLAEQLLTIGRQLQATERRLTHLPAALVLPATLQQLLTDPLARLADLIRPLANWPVPQPPPDERLPALAPFHHSPAASRPSGKPPAGSPLPAVEFTGRGAPQWSAHRGDNSRPRPTTPAAVDAQTRWWSVASEVPLTSPPPQGSRLVREHAALLSILQSNMAHPQEPPAVPGAPGALTPQAERRVTAGTAATPHRHTRVEPLTVPAHTLEGGATAAPQLAAPGNRRFVAPPAAAQQPAGVPERQPGARNGGAGHQSPELPRRVDATTETFLALPPPAPDRPHPWTLSPPGADTPLHAPQGEATSGQAMASAFQTLNAVQLEQILEALAERLELTLLRAYGTTGA